MAFQLRKCTSDRVRLPLLADPSTRAANGGDRVDALGDAHRDALLAARRLRDRADDDPERVAAELASREAEGAYLAAQRELRELAEAYRASLDPAGLELPADATFATLRPLTAAERLAANEAAFGASSPAAQLMAWAESALPRAVVEVECEGRKMGVIELLDAIEGDLLLSDVIGELVAMVRSLSGVDPVGKSRSGPPRG